MKIKSLFASLLVLTLLTCTFCMPTSAKKATVINGEVDIIILDKDISVETKEKIENYFASGEPATDDGASTYGLTCTLFGHKLESSTVVTVTHKVRTTSPKCVRRTYDYDACTRCDYEISELVATEYIVCC
ncbi:MAG: hypothetical protein E7557_09550 [Ruminococcaceae bacterium]|nr:hypothetical protein [Oscillospiraceae bacterium]